MKASYRVGSMRLTHLSLTFSVRVWLQSRRGSGEQRARQLRGGHLTQAGGFRFRASDAGSRQVYAGLDRPGKRPTNHRFEGVLFHSGRLSIGSTRVGANVYSRSFCKLGLFRHRARFCGAVAARARHQWAQSPLQSTYRLVGHPVVVADVARRCSGGPFCFPPADTGPGSRRRDATGLGHLRTPCRSQGCPSGLTGTSNAGA